MHYSSCWQKPGLKFRRSISTFRTSGQESPFGSRTSCPPERAARTLQSDSSAETERAARAGGQDVRDPFTMPSARAGERAPAVDLISRASDPGGFFGSQIENQLGDLRWLAH